MLEPSGSMNEQDFWSGHFYLQFNSLSSVSFDTNEYRSFELLALTWSCIRLLEFLQIVSILKFMLFLIPPMCINLSTCAWPLSEPCIPAIANSHQYDCSTWPALKCLVVYTEVGSIEFDDTKCFAMPCVLHFQLIPYPYTDRRLLPPQTIYPR